MAIFRSPDHISSQHKNIIQRSPVSLQEALHAGNQMLEAYPTSTVVLLQARTTFEMPRGRDGALLKNSIRIFQVWGVTLYQRITSKPTLYQAPSSISVLIVFAVVKTSQWQSLKNGKQVANVRPEEYMCGVGKHVLEEVVGRGIIREEEGM